MKTLRQQGLSLIELMIALLIGSLLILGLVQVFSASRTAYQMSEGMARVQENARFALDFLQRDIRMAGHFGCVNDQAHWVREEGDPTVHLGLGGAPLSHPLNFAVSVQGFEANGTAPGDDVTIGDPMDGWSPALPAQIENFNPQPVAGSDVLVLRFLGRRGTPVTGIAGAPGNEVLTVADSDGLTEGVTDPTLFGIADCSGASVFPGTLAGAAVEVNEVHAVPATDLVARYTPFPSGQTSLHRAESLVYYVGRRDDQPVPSLYRVRADSDGTYRRPEELVEGIESLQLLFGQDEVVALSKETPPMGHIAVRHTAAGIVANASPATDDGIANAWRRVGQVQIGLLATSPALAATPSSADAATVRVLGVNYGHGEEPDRYLRWGYESTLALRNRLFGN